MLNKSCYDLVDITINKDKVIMKSKCGIEEKQINFDVEEIRRQLNAIGHICPYTHSTYNLYFCPQLENFDLPYMNYIYYLLFFRYLRVPTFDEFLNEYVNIYCEQLPNGLLCVKNFFNNNNFAFTKEQLTGRVYRSYNSFHRELELLFQLREYDDLDVKYNFHDDINGIDLTIIYNDIPFYIASFVGSVNSFRWKNIKNSIRHDYDGKNMIDFVAHMKDNDSEKNCISYNGIYTYSPLFVAQKYFDMVKIEENINKS